MALDIMKHAVKRGIFYSMYAIIDRLSKEIIVLLLKSIMFKEMALRRPLHPPCSEAAIRDECKRSGIIAVRYWLFLHNHLPRR